MSEVHTRPSRLLMKRRPSPARPDAFSVDYRHLAPQAADTAGISILGTWVPLGLRPGSADAAHGRSEMKR